MSILKKASAGLVCAAMTVTLASCSLGGPDSSYAAVIDGEKIPAGVFIAMQYDAYYNAMFYTDPAETTVTTSSSDAAAETTATPFADKTIEGKSVREWINDEATAEMQKYAAVEKKFDELGLVFTENEPKQVELYIESLWEYYGEMYESSALHRVHSMQSLSTAKRRILSSSIITERAAKRLFPLTRSDSISPTIMQE